MLFVVVQVLKVVIAQKDMASALISIVTGVSKLVYDRPLALRAAHMICLPRPNAAPALCRPCVGCWWENAHRSVPLGSLLPSGSLSHARSSVGRWTEVIGCVWGSLGRPTPPGRRPFSISHLLVTD